MNAQNFFEILKSGNYAELTQHMESSVKVEFNRDKKQLSKNAATDLIAEKLTEFQPVKWEIMHNGSSENEDSSYTIAKAYDKQNNGLRFFIHLEDGAESKTISAIRIRKLL